MDVSVVIPCLNEASTIESCVFDAQRAIARSGTRGEVIVVDNGSTDGSPKIAARAGARVVSESRPGYGSAYLAGLASARGRAILMADGDGTYDFGDLSRLLARVHDGADLVLGSRLKGKILPGAMPWSHRWIGNPALTGLLNLLYGTRVSDAHCGLRMVRKDSLPKMGLVSPGMEFASEMVIRAKQADLRIEEVPTVYRPRPQGSTSKLNSIRDGLRHVRYIFALAPVGALALPAFALSVLAATLLAWPRTDHTTIMGGDLLLAGAAGAGLAGLALRAYRRRHLEASPRDGKKLRTVATVTAVAALSAILLLGLASLRTGRDPLHSNPAGDFDALSAPS